ncbi:MAG TPA: peptidylprolyl isomerase [Balneolaceae bacterium]|nr:peptidylprolyl isomerase [Balneolaceae bacterium]|tara:strand:+ start:206301 stop:207014 length:714 start_codon:yes stop_codon:yes gene_type:complete
MKIKHLFTVAITSVIVFGACSQQSGADFKKDAELNTLIDSVSYALGHQAGMQLAGQGFADVDVDNYVSGFMAGQIKEDSELADVNMQELFRRFSTYLVDKMKVENQKESEEFLAENKTKSGVMVTESGLQYKVIEEGTGLQPTPEDSVVVQYEGTLIDGTRFDGTYDAMGNPGDPAKFLLGGVIPGWIEGLQLMKEGSTYMFYIPSELAYGENPRPGGAIEPNDALIFKVEMLKVIK